MHSKALKYLVLIIGIAILIFVAIYFKAVRVVEPEAPLSSSSAAISHDISSPMATSAPVASSSSAKMSAAVSLPVASSSPAVIPAVSEITVAEKKASTTSFVIPVPFTSQAPLGEWSDERQQDGCEEASAAMAMAWVKSEKNISKDAWLARILALSDFEEKKYGEYRDVALNDVIGWIFNDYFDYEKVGVKPVASSTDILRELEKGKIVLVPTNGQALKNPNFTAPGPERHMLLIKGYDYKTQEFITNDPGTRRGENYRYGTKTIFDSIRPYETGNKLPFPALVKEMIVVER